MKQKKRLLSFILVLSMLITSMTGIVFAADADKEEPVYTTTWEEAINGMDISFESGSGTKEDPYIIKTAEQLAKLAADVNSGVWGMGHTNEYFKLEQDIDLSGHRWIPLGYGDGINTRSFSGFFDGNNKKITGLYVDERGNDKCAGLFGAIGATKNDAVIKNLIVEDAIVYAGYETNDNTEKGGKLYSAGILVGRVTVMGESSAEYVLIQNCKVSGKVDSMMRAGGLGGELDWAKIEDCISKATVIGKSSAGGFAGYSFMTEMNNCKAYGNVTSAGWSTGGFIGQNYESKFTKCVAYGDVKGSDWHCGGFSGYAGDEEGESSYEECIAYGNVTNSLVHKYSKTGGFIGSADGVTIKKCYATGKVTFDSKSGAAGSFVGYYTNGTFENCYSDKTKNATIDSIGENISENQNIDITSYTTDELLFKICEEIYGQHKIIKVEAKPATKTEEGHIEHWKCEQCKNAFADDKGTKVISKKDYIVPKLVETTVAAKATSVRLSKDKYTYDGKVKTPDVIAKDTKGNTLKKGTDYTVTYAKGRKNVGVYSVKVNFKGNYTGTKTLEFRIIPKNTKIKKVSGQKKAIVIKWSKQKKQTTGYQIQYSKKRNFKNVKMITVKKNGTAYKKITKCSSGKKYYVRIRTYKNVKVNGKTTKLVSAWSKIKNVKVK